MRELFIVFLGLFDDVRGYFKEYITNKPFISVLFPVSGYSASFIPDELLNTTVVKVSPILSFIDAATPYLRFIFLILTVLLSILSVVLQLKKLKNPSK